MRLLCLWQLCHGPHSTPRSAAQSSALVFREGRVKVTPVLEMQTGGSAETRQKEGVTHPFCFPRSPSDLTHFYSSASVFTTAPVLLNPLLSLPFPSLVCPAVSNPQFLSRLYLPWAFSSPSHGYSKNRGCFADVRKKYLADGFFFFPLLSL